MPDHAYSTDPAVQAQLNRLTMLSPGRDVLGLERISELLARLGNPHLALPPVFHVAGTNGKGSTCAFLRAALEAAGKSVHVYSSPHLVRFNERIRIAGKLIDDAALAPLLSEVLDCSEDLNPSFFEATTAVAFLSFARSPANAAVIEVGLGGRLDATNIIPQPAVCGIASLGIDHESFLLDPDNGPAYPPLERIAYEKAGIAKAGSPLVTMAYPAAMANRVAEAAMAAKAPYHPKGSDWDAAPYQGKLHYRDAHGKLSLPLPAMHGAHQAMNAALAIAMIRHQSVIEVPEAALKAGVGWAHWPARLQRLAPGPFAGEREVWLDGGHNADCGIAVADHFREYLKPGRTVHLICGILANKDARGVLAPFADLVSEMTAVSVPGHPSHAPEALRAMAEEVGLPCRTGSDVRTAIDASNADVTIILGSLYLAGDVLRANNQIPD
jgi:dihydrofolate synthase / folylpolyglutamate synthase